MKVAKKWIRGPADVLAVRLGYWFDLEAANHAVEFIETFCCPSEGVGAGKPLVLLDWQKDFVMRLFGWKRPDGLRRYRKAYVEIPKKNGKSMLLSAIILLLLMADGEPSPKIYLNAVDREQAAIIFDESRKMVEASPELAKRLEIINSKSDKRIIFPANNGVVIANSSVVGSKDGLNAHAVVFDEIHQQPDRRLLDVFEYASIAREQPVWIGITTAGEDDTGPWHELRVYAERNNRGDVDPPDLEFLGVVYRADPDDDIDSPATWRKANPSLGHVLKEEEFANALRAAKETPEKWPNFIRLRLNIIAHDEGALISSEAWAKCGPADGVAKRADLSLFKGVPCNAGGDLSTRIDITALVAVWGDLVKGFDVACWCYLPEDNVAELSRRDRVNYRAWADAGWLTLTPGCTIDYGFLRAEINRLKDGHDLRVIAMDPKEANHLNQLLSSEDGIDVRELRQGFLSLSDPTKELQRLAHAGLLRHDGNPILKWCLLNAVAEKDAAGLIKLSKRKSRQKIDAAAALVNAIAAALSGGEAGRAGRPSKYETEGMMVL